MSEDSANVLVPCSIPRIHYQRRPLQHLQRPRPLKLCHLRLRHCPRRPSPWYPPKRPLQRRPRLPHEHPPSRPPQRRTLAPPTNGVVNGDFEWRSLPLVRSGQEQHPTCPHLPRRKTSCYRLHVPAGGAPFDPDTSLHRARVRVKTCLPLPGGHVVLLASIPASAPKRKAFVGANVNSKPVKTVEAFDSRRRRPGTCFDCSYLFVPRSGLWNLRFEFITGERHAVIKIDNGTEIFRVNSLLLLLFLFLFSFVFSFF